MAMTVARVKHLSSADVKACVRNSTPIIATEMLKSWRASTLWSFDYFKQNDRSHVVTLSDGSFRALARMPLARCIDLILGMDLGEDLQVRRRDAVYPGLGGARSPPRALRRH